MKTIFGDNSKLRWNRNMGLREYTGFTPLKVKSRENLARASSDVQGLTFRSKMNRMANVAKVNRSFQGLTNLAKLDRGLKDLKSRTQY